MTNRRYPILVGWLSLLLLLKAPSCADDNGIMEELWAKSTAEQYSYPFHRKTDRSPQLSFIGALHASLHSEQGVGLDGQNVDIRQVQSFLALVAMDEIALETVAGRLTNTLHGIDKTANLEVRSPEDLRQGAIMLAAALKKPDIALRVPWPWCIFGNKCNG